MVNKTVYQEAAVRSETKKFPLVSPPRLSMEIPPEEVLWATAIDWIDKNQGFILRSTRRSKNRMGSEDQDIIQHAYMVAYETLLICYQKGELERFVNFFVICFKRENSSLSWGGFHNFFSTDSIPLSIEPFLSTHQNPLEDFLSKEEKEGIFQRFKEVFPLLPDSRRLLLALYLKAIEEGSRNPLREAAFALGITEDSCRRSLNRTAQRVAILINREGAKNAFGNIRQDKSDPLKNTSPLGAQRSFGKSVDRGQFGVPGLFREGLG